jgi:3-methyladenine DNA glycosylase AlkD
LFLLYKTGVPDMLSLEDVLKELNAKARQDQLEGMARYKIVREKRLGVSIPDLRKMAKEIGKDHNLALKLWKTGIQDARILAAMVDRPEEVTEQQMDTWVRDINSWDVCDQVCMNLFEKVPFARKMIAEWSKREEEFVKRAAFALIACLAWHDKEASDEDLVCFFPIIKGGATDERNFVKKAVNWALRNIGKRNPNLNKAAIEAATEIGQMDSRAARWVASGALRELESEAVQKRLRK